MDIHREGNQKMYETILSREDFSDFDEGKVEKNIMEKGVII
jgi:hypothetical protein